MSDIPSVTFKTITAPGMGIKTSNKKAFEYETDTHMPQLHQACLIVGPRGSGKSTILVNMLERLPFDRLFIISPTMKSNMDLMQRVKAKKIEVFEDPDDVSILDKIKKSMEDEAALLDQYTKKKKLYDDLMAKLDSDTPLFCLPDDILLNNFYLSSDDVATGAGEFKPPTHWLDGRKACCGLVIDDALGSMLFTKGIRKMNNFTILHRHLGQLETGGSLGLSLFFLTQSYKAVVGGISRVIRGNCTSMILFRSKDKTQTIEMSKELAGEVEPEEFLRMYEFATAKPHSALFVDLFRKKEHPSAFRVNLDEYILPQDVAEFSADFSKKST